MELNQFIENFAAQFDDTELSDFKAETEFKKLEEWSSLTSLSIIAMVDEEYDTAIKGDDLKSALTIEALFEIMKTRV